MKATEGKRAVISAHDLDGLSHFKKFNVEILQLHDTIVRAPRMPIARSDREAGTRIKFRRGIEISDGMDGVVDPFGHQTELPLHQRELHPIPLLIA